MGMRPSGVAKMTTSAVTSHHGKDCAQSTPKAEATVEPSMSQASQVVAASVMAGICNSVWATRVFAPTGVTSRSGFCCSASGRGSAPAMSSASEPRRGWS